MAVTRKTSDLFARIQMARHESFARVGGQEGRGRSEEGKEWEGEGEKRGEKGKGQKRGMGSSGVCY
jgi:hypothetical protein